jgi:hypothetical protein
MSCEEYQGSVYAWQKFLGKPTLVVDNPPRLSLWAWVKSILWRALGRE